MTELADQHAANLRELLGQIAENPGWAPTEQTPSSTLVMLDQLHEGRWVQPGLDGWRATDRALDCYPHFEGTELWDGVSTTSSPQQKEVHTPDTNHARELLRRARLQSRDHSFIISTLEEIMAVIDDLTTAFNDYQAAVNAAFASLNQAVTDLIAEVQAGGTPDPAKVQALEAAMAAATTAAQGEQTQAASEDPGPQPTAAPAAPAAEAPAPEAAPAEEAPAEAAPEAAPPEAPPAQEAAGATPGDPTGA